MQVVIRWGDPSCRRAGLHPAGLTADAQEKQFGYNNDYLGLLPLPAGQPHGDRFLLVANHEYTNSNLMFPGLGAGRQAGNRSRRREVAVEMAPRMGGAWSRSRARTAPGRWWTDSQLRTAASRRHADGTYPARQPATNG